MSLDLQPDALAIVQEILRRQVPERAVWAFGSRVRGTARPVSDLDLCICGDEFLGFERLGRLRDAFSASALPFRVDVVELATSSESFRRIIEREKVVVQDRKQPAHTLEETSWPRLSLKQSGIILIDCDHKTPPESDSGYPYIAIPQIRDGKITLEGVRRISYEHYTEWTRKLKPQHNDVIVVRRCNSGDTAVVPKGLECTIGQNLVVLRADGTMVLPEFLRWLLQSPEWWEEVRKYINVWAVFDSLKCREIPDFELTIPPVSAQHKITNILKALDDRITLLRETNATLEAIAQALFKSWFIDFDPVHARQQGLAPEGMDEATAAPFPDSFEESELGLIPKGWRVGVLGDIATLNPESWTTKNHPTTVAYIDLANTKDNIISVITDYTFDEAPSRARRVLRNGDTIVGTVRPGNRSFAFIHEPPINLTASTGFAVLRPNKNLYTELVFLISTQPSSIDCLSHLADGGAYPAVRPEVIETIQCVLPDDLVVKVFHKLSSPLLVKVTENQHQAQILTTLRDTLLPRLISGQLRLPEVERSVGEVIA
ncbi:hypothetical protein SIID45300_02129 [Candidatus Magnetaquicoccaceae bacterium FCR-1]|uniref:Restriction endonuclease subunit S n=1 Tax=Candidatus Magnetaquiglobus chichijimensis TaxID=3141448 RepID=A0ABQ0CA79_9PROT